jgi:predicted RNase H-like HicB family nuclease
VTLSPAGPGYDISIASEIVGGVRIFVASNPAIPRCYSQGHSPSEAIGNLEDARRMILDHLQTHHLAVPEPVAQPRLVEQQVTVAAPSSSLRGIPVAA